MSCGAMKMWPVGDDGDGDGDGNGEDWVSGKSIAGAFARCRDEGRAIPISRPP
jgi:hypothetical protein